MAAILEPHRHPLPTPVRRPDLRVLPGTGPGPSRPAVGDRRPHPALALVAVLALVVVMAGAVAVGRGALAGLAPAPPAASGSATGPVSGTTVVVRPGDTLWSIARRLQPSGDIRPLVDRLVAAHGSATIVPGDRIVVPS